MTELQPSARPTVADVALQDSDNFNRLCEIIFPVMLPYADMGVPDELIMGGQLLFESTDTIVSDASRVKLVVSFINQLNSRIQLDYIPAQRQGYFSSGPQSFAIYGPDEMPSLYVHSLDAIEEQSHTMKNQKLFNESRHRAAMIRRLGSDSTRFTGLLLPSLGKV